MVDDSLRRPDCDNERVVCRVSELGAVGSVIPCGNHNNDPCPPGPLYRVGERIDLVVLYAVCAEGQVYHSNVQAVCVSVGDHPVDGRDHLADVYCAVGARNLDTDQPSIGGDAEHSLRPTSVVSLGPILVGSDDDAGQMRTVTVGVEASKRRIRIFEGEVRTADDVAVPKALNIDDAGID